MARYEVVMSVVVDARDEDHAYQLALYGWYDRKQTIVEEDGIRRLPKPVEVKA